jgi:hypothetical protein
MPGNFLKFRLFEVAILALGTRDWPVALARLHYQLVWVMTHNTVKSQMLALEELFILLVVVDEATLGIHLLNRASPMALTAHLSIAIDLHTETARVRGM